jgi:TonB-linked SusC/RagA family outer membrane protein
MKYLYIFFLLVSPLYGLCQTITGTVKNPKSEPLEGITVSVKGTSILTITNEKGQFKIQVPNADCIIRFTATGLDPLEVQLSGQKNLTVMLNPKTTGLDEVQVIAYGTSTQRNSVGSITQVSGEDINKQGVTNPLAALEGRVPGLVVTSSSGIPGASFTVQIRGQNTLNPSKALNQVAPIDNPLFIVDGIPFAPQNSNVNQFRSLASPGSGNVYNNRYGGLSPFNSINPADIESIEILRDADATAIYGSRGGNGVILITTKKGKAGKTAFDMNVIDGISVVGHTMPMMNISQYLAMRHNAFANDGITPDATIYDPGYAPDLTVFDTTKNTNWKKVFLGNTAHNLNVNASLSGGTANTQFHFGTGINRDTYIFPGNYADNRITFSANLHHTSEDKRLTIDFSSIFAYDKNNSSGDQSLLSAFILEPDYPSLLDAKGNLVWNYKDVPLDGSYAAYNPFAYLKELYTIQNNSLNSNFIVGYKIMDGLTFRTSLGYSTFYSKEYYGDPVSAQNPEFSPIATARFGNNNFTTWIIEPQLEYKNTFKKGIYSILAGGTLQKESNYSTEVDGSGYINDDLIQSISGAPTQTASDSYSDYKYIALFGRFNLRWDSKYILDLTARRDGSSRFGPANQFGNFGSVGGGWLFNEESFVKNNLAFLSYGKLRGSYGITGNDAIANYQYLSRWAPTQYSYDGNLGYAPQNLYNPNFSWATTKKLEFGLELGFFKNNLLFTSTWFRNRSGNQLVTYQLPGQTGFSSVLENWNAEVQNTGIELSLQASIVKNKLFSWNASFNMTLPKNKLLSFPNLAESSYATTYVVGQSLSVINKFKYAGVDPATGLFQFYNANGQLTENPSPASSSKFNDFQDIGNLDPKFYGGLSNSVNYKGFQLDVFLEYRKQLGVNYLAQVYNYIPGNEFNQPAALLTRWTTPGQITNIERFSSQYGQEATEASNFVQSSGVYSDASYIRVKTVSFSYSLPDAFVKKLNVRALRFYATSQNLFTITNYKGNDPETQSFYGVPPLKSVSFGLQLTL